ncbi:MAG TPA: hypothetical protein DEG44_01075 [Candidatus Kerfeldbacteria bacterium]|nr:hypothetical protein [Candidatus Kerfeldbacteria bacterium]
MMMCKCCDGSQANCGCMHHKLPMCGSVCLVILGVLLFLTNYGWLSMDIWKWLLPLALVLGGIWHGMCCGMKRMDHCKTMQCCKHDGDMKK